MQAIANCQEEVRGCKCSMAAYVTCFSSRITILYFLNSLSLLPLPTPTFVRYSLVSGTPLWHTSLSDIHTVHTGTHILSPAYINPCTFVAQTSVVLTHRLR